MERNYVTLAIHTYSFASALKKLLEKHGIPVQLENVNIANPEPACGIRVRIPQDELPKALTIVESSASLSSSAIEMEFEGVQNKMLVPVDFSDTSLEACRVAFDFAQALKLHPVILHVYATPYFDSSLSSTDSFTLDVRDAEARKSLESSARYEMKRFCARLDAMMADGLLPAIRYSTLLNEGMPEEAILSFTRQTPPELVVMSTRNADKRSRELIGSVTAEVVDSCRVSVLTWPAGTDYEPLDRLTRSVFFCNIDQNDLLAMDMYIRLFNDMPLHITLVPVADKSGSKSTGRLRSLLRYFRQNYPQCEFDSFVADAPVFREQLEPWAAGEGIKLIVVPNKKKNIFARLFNPGMAHRVVFDSNLPMLALPV